MSWWTEETSIFWTVVHGTQIYKVLTSVTSSAVLHVRIKFYSSGNSTLKHFPCVSTAERIQRSDVIVTECDSCIRSSEQTPIPRQLLNHRTDWNKLNCVISFARTFSILSLWMQLPRRPVGYLTLWMCGMSLTASYMRSPGEKELLLHCVIHVISFLTCYSSHYMPESFLSSSRTRERETEKRFGLNSKLHLERCDTISLTFGHNNKCMLLWTCKPTDACWNDLN